MRANHTPMNALACVAVSLVGMACTETEEAPRDGAGSEEARACLDGESYELAADEVSPLGFSAASVLLNTEGEFVGTVDWTDGTQSALTLTVAHDGGSARYTELVYGGSAGDEASCQSGYVSTTIEVQIVTADGELDETLAIDLIAWDEDTVESQSDLAAVSGTLSLESFVAEPARYDDIIYGLRMQFLGDHVTGTIGAEGHGSEGEPTDPNATLFVEAIPIGQLEAERVPLP